MIKLRWLLFKQFLSLCIQKVFSLFNPIRHDPTLLVSVLEHQVINQKTKKTKPSKLFLAPQDGNAWNPALKFPRNEFCFCGSGIKFKKCCLPNQPGAVDEALALKIAPAIKVIRKEAK